MKKEKKAKKKKKANEKEKATATEKQKTKGCKGCNSPVCYWEDDDDWDEKIICPKCKKLSDFEDLDDGYATGMMCMICGHVEVDGGW